MDAGNGSLASATRKWAILMVFFFRFVNWNLGHYMYIYMYIYVCINIYIYIHICTYPYLILFWDRLWTLTSFHGMIALTIACGLLLWKRLCSLDGMLMDAAKSKDPLRDRTGSNLESEGPQGAFQWRSHRVCRPFSDHWTMVLGGFPVPISMR